MFFLAKHCNMYRIYKNTDNIHSHTHRIQCISCQKTIQNFNIKCEFIEIYLTVTVSDLTAIKECNLSCSQ